MTFKVLIDSDIFYNIPAERRSQFKEALKELENPLPGGRKKKVKGHVKGAYRLRVGDFRNALLFNCKKLFSIIFSAVEKFYFAESFSGRFS